MCSPRQPACGLCPWQGVCEGYAQGTAATLPRKTPKAERPVRYGVHFMVMDRAGNVLLRKRPETGLLAAMTELPGTEWRATPWTEAEALAHAPVAAQWSNAGAVKHVFTHFTLELVVYAGQIPQFSNQQVAEGFLLPPAQARKAALPSVMLKCLATGLKALA